MSDDLRTRIAKVLHRQFGSSLGAHPDGWDREPVGTQEMYLEDADAVIRELPELTALRRCGRCRIPCLPDEYPPMSEGSNELRPFCIRCTKYIFREIPQHVTARINDGWYVCETCGATGSERWANLHQFPFTNTATMEPLDE